MAVSAIEPYEGKPDVNRLIAAMRRAEAKLDPVLATFRDQPHQTLLSMHADLTDGCWVKAI